MGTAERVAKGFEFLDGRFPGWRDYIRLEDLNMADGCLCVLGQVAEHPAEFDLPDWVGTYATMLSFLGKDEVWAVKHGFNAEEGSHDPDCEDDCSSCLELEGLRDEWDTRIREAQ